MPNVTKEINGIKIEIDDADNVSVAGKEIVYDVHSSSGKFSSNYLPYTEYDSLEELAEAIVTQTEEFKTPQA